MRDKSEREKRPRLKSATIAGCRVVVVCAECQHSFTQYRWSPLFCPECDERRVERISRQLGEIIDSLDKKKEVKP